MENITWRGTLCCSLNTSLIGKIKEDGKYRACGQDMKLHIFLFGKPDKKLF